MFTEWPGEVLTAVRGSYYELHADFVSLNTIINLNQFELKLAMIDFIRLSAGQKRFRSLISGSSPFLMDLANPRN